MKKPNSLKWIYEPSFTASIKTWEAYAARLQQANEEYPDRDFLIGYAKRTIHEKKYRLGLETDPEPRESFPRSRLPVVLIDNALGRFDTVEAWQSWRDELEAMEHFQGQDQHIQFAKRQIASLKKKARRKSITNASS
jgi:hypothetical protein